MINTDYNALNVYASDTRSRASQTSDMTLVSEENARGAKNARSTNDVAAVLTLSARAAAKTPIVKRGSSRSLGMIRRVQTESLARTLKMPSRDFRKLIS